MPISFNSSPDVNFGKAKHLASQHGLCWCNWRNGWVWWLCRRQYDVYRSKVHSEGSSLVTTRVCTNKCDTRELWVGKNLERLVCNTSSRYILVDNLIGWAQWLRRAGWLEASNQHSRLKLVKVLQGVSFSPCLAGKMHGPARNPETDAPIFGFCRLCSWLVTHSSAGLSLLFFDVLGLKGFQIPSPNHTNLEKSKHMSEECWSSIGRIAFFV